MKKLPLLTLAVLPLLAACDEQQGDPLAPTPPAVSAQQPAPLYLAEEDGIPGSYIVVLEEDADATELARAADVSPDAVYDGTLQGFSAALDDRRLELLRHLPEVAYVEQDRIVKLEGTQDLSSSGNNWGIDRIDQRKKPLSKSYNYRDTGSGVYAYVIDSGLQANHPQFEGRAKNVYDAWGGSGDDCRGHGTHVGGIIGSKKYGVAKKIQLRGMRVLNCNGSGKMSAVIAALDWVRKNRRNPAVASLSLSTSVSASFNDAVNRLASSGVFVAVAAGNSGRDACNYSPSSASGAFVTGATSYTDRAQSWSNWGSCVTAFAPGAGIRSTYLNSGSYTMTGTSMAAPHVAGIAALYKDKYGNASSSTIKSWIRNKATTGVVEGSLRGSPNRLVYTYGL